MGNMTPDTEDTMIRPIGLTMMTATEAETIIITTRTPQGMNESV